MSIQSLFLRSKIKNLQTEFKGGKAPKNKLTQTNDINLTAGVRQVQFGFD
jgi:hypothetical protein